MSVGDVLYRMNISTVPIIRPEYLTLVLWLIYAVNIFIWVPLTSMRCGWDGNRTHSRNIQIGQIGNDDQQPITKLGPVWNLFVELAGVGSLAPVRRPWRPPCAERGAKQGSQTPPRWRGCPTGSTSAGSGPGVKAQIGLEMRRE
jgi:hypothetical protein